MFQLKVDSTIPDNSFVKAGPYRFRLILELMDIYGEDGVAEGFETLIKGEEYVMWFSNKQQVTCSIRPL